MVMLRVTNDKQQIQPLNIQVDTGARVNVLCYRDLKQVTREQYKMSSTNIKLRCYSGSAIVPKGRVDLEIQLKHRTVKLPFIIVRESRPPLLLSQSADDPGIIKVHDI